MYIYIYTYVYMYNHIHMHLLHEYIHMSFCMHEYIYIYLCTTYNFIYIYISPPLTLEYLGRVGQEISQDHMKIPPHMFFGLQKKWGGSSGCHILAQRWYGTPFHFRRTYIHIYIHACIPPGPGETIITIFF